MMRAEMPVLPPDIGHRVYIVRQWGRGRGNFGVREPEFDPGLPNTGYAISTDDQVHGASISSCVK